MRIFNEEVFNCGQCPLVIRDEYHVGCQKLDKEFYYFDTINKDCPFNKPITKEVIEGFGFDVSSVSFDFEKGNFQLEILKCKYLITRNHGEDILFWGTINNPIELEFILRSIGVIE